MRQHRILLLLLIILSGTFATLYGGNIPRALFYLTLCIPLAAFLDTLYIYLRLKMYQTIGKRTVVKGEVTDYVFHLSNEDFISYQNIRISFFQDKSRILNFDDSREYNLLPGETQYFETSICCNYRGEYEIGAKAVTITDFLDLFSISYPVTSRMKVTVLPRVIHLSEIPLIASNADSKRNLTGPSEEEEADAQVRNYCRGDLKKRIHWKASAKKQELLVRNYVSLPKTGILLFLDLSPIEPSDGDPIVLADRSIETVLALADYCLRKRIPCEIWYEQSELMRCVLLSASDFDNFYEQCVHLHFHAKHTMNSWLEDTMSHASDLFLHSQTILVSHRMDEDTYKCLSDMVNMGISAHFLYVCSSLSPEELALARLMNQSAIPITLCSDSVSLEESLSSDQNQSL